MFLSYLVISYSYKAADKSNILNAGMDILAMTTKTSDPQYPLQQLFQ